MAAGAAAGAAKQGDSLAALDLFADLDLDRRIVGIEGMESLAVVEFNDLPPVPDTSRR